MIDPLTASTAILGAIFAFVSAVQSGGHIIRRMWDGLKRYFGHARTSMSMLPHAFAQLIRKMNSRGSNRDIEFLQSLSRRRLEEVAGSLFRSDRYLLREYMGHSRREPRYVEHSPRFVQYVYLDEGPKSSRRSDHGFEGRYLEYPGWSSGRSSRRYYYDDEEDYY
jgi:hypothetical protein